MFVLDKCIGFREIDGKYFQNWRVEPEGELAQMVERSENGNVPTHFPCNIIRALFLCVMKEF